MKKAQKVCQVCGKSFYGSQDRFYCPTCAKEKKMDAVIKTRICQDCGTEFSGGPRAKRCPSCAEKARYETNKRHRVKGTNRPMGSIDKCQWCGQEYTVASGRQKYCSEKCQRLAVLAWQRDHKKGYNKSSGQEAKKQHRRDDAKRICIYCGQAFSSKTSTNLCSDYCRSEHKKILQCVADINRGRNRDLQKYLKKQEEFREMKRKEANAIR